MSDSIKRAQKKYSEAKERIASIRYNIIILIILLAFFAKPLAKFFSYEVTEEVTVKKEYQYQLGTIDTYVCYTTQYGYCYHAKECGYLWNSSNKTTVYEARKAGYKPCSNCTPTVETTLKLTETRYRNVTKKMTVTKEPTFLVLLCGTGCLVIAYFVLTNKPRKERSDASAEILRLKSNDALIRPTNLTSETHQREESAGVSTSPIPHSQNVHNVVELKSSFLASAEYIDPVLYLTFRDGRRYAYNQVPREIYDGLIVAPSPGKYFHENIQNNYSCSAK